MPEPTEHKDCRGRAAALAAAAPDLVDGEACDVTAADPGDPNLASFTCPHGVRYWIVPAGGTS